MSSQRERKKERRQRRKSDRKEENTEMIDGDEMYKVTSNERTKARSGDRLGIQKVGRRKRKRGENNGDEREK